MNGKDDRAVERLIKDLKIIDTFIDAHGPASLGLEGCVEFVAALNFLAIQHSHWRIEAVLLKHGFLKNKGAE